MRPALTSCIDTLLERFDADPLDVWRKISSGSPRIPDTRRFLDHGDLAAGTAGREWFGLNRLVGTTPIVT
jgi:hypothetical protein